MDLQALADRMPAMTCVISVEKHPESGKGIFRLVAGNKAYIDSIEHPAPGMAMLSDKFVPGSEYTDYLTRDLNFEDASYNAAMNKKCIHSYAKPDRLPFWFSMIFLPVEYEDDDYCYCLYIMEVNVEADPEQIALFFPREIIIALFGVNDGRFVIFLAFANGDFPGFALIIE